MLRLIRPPRQHVFALISIVLLGLACLSGHPTAAKSAPPESLATTDQLIVAFRPSTTIAAQASAQPDQIAGTLSTTAGTALAYVRPLAASTYVLRLASVRPYSELAAIARQIAARPDVLFAAPDAMVYPDQIPSDPFYATSNWELQAKGSGFYATNLPAAWDITTGAAGVGIAIIDTGALLNHEDLVGRTLASNRGYDMIWNLSAANDGDGRDADPSDPGDYVTSAESVSLGCGSRNSSWHGSHVAGTIGASANNGKGVTGINWVSPLLFIRVLGKCGGYFSDTNDAIRWAAGLAVAGVPLNPNPVRVINLSLGSALICEAATQSAINDAVAAGVVVVAAAGNDNLDAAGSSPGGCTGVITVAASRKDGGKAAYSNYGATVEIAAPGGASGELIYSTVSAGSQGPTSDAYSGKAGTSMATPHVTGIVSLMLSANPSLTPAQVLEILQATATPFPVGSDCSGRCGAGIVDAAAAVEEAARRVRTVGYRVPSQTVSEAVGTVRLPVQLSVASTQPITVPYTVDGTATSADHTLISGTLTIPAGQRSADLTFSIVDDTLMEPDESIVITLGTPTSTPTVATLATPAVHTITIRDNEVPAGALSPPTLGFGDQQVGSTNTLTATLTNINSLPLTINGIEILGASFARVGGTCAPAFPAILPTNASCTVQVRFTPTAPGAQSGSLSVTTNGLGNSYHSTLTGQGVQAGQLSVDAPTLTLQPGPVTISVKVRRTSGSDGVIAAHYTLSGASDGAVLAEGEVTFTSGETERSVSVTLTRAALGPAQRLNFTLSNATGGASLTDPSARTFVIFRSTYLPLLLR